MNRANLKSYAPQARRDFIQAMTDRAAFYGLTAENIEPVIEQGDVAMIGGRAFPKSVIAKRKRLENRVKRDGIGQTMEAMAYTWFNRLVAIRYMELHGYLEHGYRALSNADPAKTSPEILEHAEHVDLPGLKSDTVINLKLDGNKDAELYRMLLVAQCNALHAAMPFLFEKIDDETELLLPDNLLHSDSLIRKLVSEIDEEDWREVEIIGWLYQFYISEKKDEVIGKVVASEDIPAATQLFTPNWIVKYLVQNTLGRQWLATYPQSPLRQQMEYYIEPAEQTPEVQEQLTAITPTSLNPEDLTLLDPACGSGHILVEAYDLFKAIYQERGYRAKDIPALILQKNLFGLEIDDRAAQLAAFALMMKARADDRRIFDSEAKPNIVAIQESKGLNAGEIYFALTSPLKGNQSVAEEPPAPDGHLFEPEDNLFTRAERANATANRQLPTANFSQADIASLLEVFAYAKTFGSLIQIPPKLAVKLPGIENRLDAVLKFGDLTHASAHVLKPLLQQAGLLARQYDAVVANPPYMGGKFFNERLKQFVTTFYTDAKADLYACFIERNAQSTKPNGFIGMITIPNWMCLSSFDKSRHTIFHAQTIDSFVHNGRGVFGSDFGSCAFVLRNHPLRTYHGSFRRLFDKQGSVASNEELQRRFFSGSTFHASSCDFEMVPGSPVAYWPSKAVRQLFKRSTIGTFTFSEGAVKTGNNPIYLRMSWEVQSHEIGPAMKWRRHPKGGDARKWYGNVDWVVNWTPLARQHYREDHIARILEKECWDLEGICWTAVSISRATFRFLRSDEVANNAALSLFAKDGCDLKLLLGFLNSKVVDLLMSICSPTVNFLVGDVQSVPFLRDSPELESTVSSHVKTAIDISKSDWDSRETSIDFAYTPLLDRNQSFQSIEAAFAAWTSVCDERHCCLKNIETEINACFIDAYCLQGELEPNVPDDQITLYRPGREEDTKRLLSYAIGCMMGRYSLDAPGLIYAHSRNEGFDSSQYKQFRADDDGIIPLLETDWGIRDDAANRIVEFVGMAWPKEHLDENLTFITDSLGPTGSEQPRDTIRRYLATGFYKHHLTIYKRRPIYWMFASGKQRAFQCLVYLHRYHEGTLARMRTEYVIPLQGRYSANIEQLANDISAATSTSQRKKLEKERDKLIKHQAELQTFDEKLKHAADQRITLDLDDGVKVNYGKFGDLLAEGKAICGSKEDD